MSSSDSDSDDSTTDSGTKEDSGTGSDTGSDAGSTKEEADDGSASGSGDDKSESGDDTKESESGEDTKESGSGDDTKEESGEDTKSESGEDNKADDGSGSDSDSDESSTVEEEVIEEEVVDQGLPTIAEEATERGDVHETASPVETTAEPSAIEAITDNGEAKDGEAKDGERAMPKAAARDLEAQEDIDGGYWEPAKRRLPKEDVGTNPFVTCFCCLLFFAVLTAAIAAPLDYMNDAGGKNLQATEISRGTDGASNAGPPPTPGSQPTPTAPTSPSSPTSPTSTPGGEPTTPAPVTPTVPPGPTASPTTANLGQFLNNFLIPRFGEAPFEDPTSAESKAADHMSDNDPYIFQGPVENEDELGDRYAVTAMYYALNGESWQSCGMESETCFAGNWLVGDHCTWAGITCNEDQRVTNINFSVGFTGGPIEGTIPSAISLLTELEDFKLTSGSVTGALPNEFLGLSNLSILDLTDLDLNGPLPEGLGDLSNLENLLLAGNSFTGTVPDSLGGLLDLRK